MVDVSSGTTALAIVYMTVSAASGLVALRPSLVKWRHRSSAHWSYFDESEKSSGLGGLATFGSFKFIFGVDVWSTLALTLARIDTDGQDPAYQTLRGVGYILLAVRAAAACFASGSPTVAGVEAEATPWPARISYLLVAAAVVMAILSVVFEPEANGSAETSFAFATALGGNAVVGIYALYGFFFGDIDDEDDTGIFSTKVGRAILAIGAALYIAAGALFLALNNKCNTAAAYTDGGDCPLGEGFNHNGLSLLLQTIGTLVYLFGLIRPGRKEELAAQGSSNPSVEFYDAPKVTNPIKQDSNPATTPEPSKPSQPKPADTPKKGSSKSTPKKESTKPTPKKGSTKSTKKPELPAVVPSTPATKETTFHGPPPGRVIIDDLVLKKMYDIFTATDGVDVDTHMDAEEFAQKVSVDAMRKALDPIGGLDISKLLKPGESPPVLLDSNVLFWLLDRDHSDSVTIREFLELCKKRYAQTPTNTILQDSVLKKLYDMFSAADQGVADSGLSAKEFEQRVDVEELKKTLSSVGGLQVQWIYKLKGPKVVQARALFKILDDDLSGHVTIQEFIDMLKGSRGKILG